VKTIGSTVCFLAGCYHIHAMTIGPPVDARPAGCTVEVARTRPQDLVAAWEQVGAICIVPDRNLGSVEQPYQPGEIRDRLREKACELGGELMAAQSTCGTHSNPGVELGVWRHRPPENAEDR
jgi:hypothetical protein